jgi:hypothetical protein
MIIRGILDKSLSRQTCVRGFARIKELARISKANPDYQRELVDKQKKVISNFLTEENYLFFPEVILSLKLKYDYTQKGAKTISPITLLDTKKTFTSNVNSVSVKPLEYKNNKTFDIGGRDEIKIVEIEIEDGFLNQLIEKNEHLFHRIDGNHRLSAAEQNEGDRINLMDVPFCIVLFEELTSEKFNTETGILEKQTDKQYEKFERVVFYNINSKTEPLTLEQNLRGILGETDYFKDDEIEHIFKNDGKNVGLSARYLGKRINPEDFNSLKNILKENKWAFSLNIIKLYNKFKEKGSSYSTNTLVEKVFESLQAVNVLYSENESLIKNNSSEILLSFVYNKAFSDKRKFEYYTDWIISNHLFNAKETKAESIIKIFNKINQNKIVKVFVAMPFYETGIVEEYNKLFKEVLIEIQAKAKSELTLELIPIMNFKGKSERIDKQLLEKIKDCNVFIADLSGCNENVIFEIAYAEGCGKEMIIIKSNLDKKPPPFDMDKLRYVTFQKSTYYTSIKSIIDTHLIEILKKTYLINF